MPAPIVLLLWRFLGLEAVELLDIGQTVVAYKQILHVLVLSIVSTLLLVSFRRLIRREIIALRGPQTRSHIEEALVGAFVARLRLPPLGLILQRQRVNSELVEVVGRLIFALVDNGEARDISLESLLLLMFLLDLAEVNSAPLLLECLKNTLILALHILLKLGMVTHAVATFLVMLVLREDTHEFFGGGSILGALGRSSPLNFMRARLLYLYLMNFLGYGLRR